MEGTSALGPAILPPIIPHKTRPNYALTQEVKPANDAVDGRWPQEQETTTGSNEAKVQKRSTPNNTATNNTTIPAPIATPEQVGNDDVKDDNEDNDEDDNDDVQVGREVASNGGDSPEEHEKEERRRTAQRVLLKQG